MSLDRYVENAWLRKEPSSPQEIAGLLSIVNRCRKDAGVEGISDEELRQILATVENLNDQVRTWLTGVGGSVSVDGQGNRQYGASVQRGLGKVANVTGGVSGTIGQIGNPKCR